MAENDDEAKRYPEHAKMDAMSADLRQAVGEFVEWLKLNDYIIATVDYPEYDGEPELQGKWHMSAADWVALYLDVDPQKLEAEKRQMLDTLRLHNHQRDVLAQRARNKASK